MKLAARAPRQNVVRAAKLFTALSLSADAQPPSEFLVFRKGLNDTEIGTFLFDDAAAKQVMSHYEERNVDVQIDLEHLSLEDSQTSVNYDPDARGWAKLELRNGDLWCVNVAWTPDGVTRLTQKTQRYTSPAFITEKGSDGATRIVELINVALVANPATHDLPALVAASQKKTAPPRRVTRLSDGSGATTMNLTPEQLAAIAEAFGLPSDATYEDVVAAVGAWLKQVQDAANGNAAPPDPADGTDAVGDPAAMAASLMNRLGKALVIASAKSGTPKDLVALRTAIFNETERTTSLDAINVIRSWKTSHATITAERAKLEEQRASLEASDRVTLVRELVTCGAETPATAWAKDNDGMPDATKPAPIFTRMTLDELKQHVAAKKAQHKANTRKGADPAASEDDVDGGKEFTVAGKTVKLSARELKMCADQKIDPATYAAKKAAKSLHRKAS